MRAWMIERFGNGPKPLILGFHIRWFRVYEAQELLRDTAYHFLGGIEADRLSVLRRMREEVRICALPSDQRKQAVEDFAAQDAHVPWYCAQASTLGNNLLGCFGGIDCCDMQIELMRTAIAIERYRLANADRLPETIGDLIPRYLARIPVTPMTCEQAVYTPGKNDYVVRIGRAAPAPGLGPGPGPGVWSFQELKVDFPAK